MDFPESAEADDITAGKIVTTAGQDRGDAQLQAATKKGCFWLCREAAQQKGDPEAAFFAVTG
jgi:hypothetical protein